jgi:restriction system protein
MLKVKAKVPGYGEFIWPTVVAFRELGGSADKQQLLDKIAELMRLPEDVVAEPHHNGPQTEVSYRVAWVQTWLKHAGILENPKRGVWVLTLIGRAVSKEDAESVAPNKKRVASKGKDDTRTEVDIAPPLVVPVDESEWQTDVLDTIKNMSPAAFERLAKRLLLELGFSKVTVTGGSGDGGIDAVGTVTVNSVLTFKVVVQCKRYRDTVGAGDLRNFRGAMQGRTDKALFITTGSFTRGAIDEATRDGVPEIDLISGEDLTAILKELKLGVKTEMVEKVSVVKEFFADI